MPRRHHPGDPWDVLHLAVTSLRLIGGILLLLAVLGALALLVGLRIDDFFETTEAVAQLMVRIGPYVLAGGAFLVAAQFVNRRQRWAAVVAICLTSLALFVTAILLVSLIVLAWTPNYASVWLAGAILAVAAFAFALGQLIFHLTRTFAAMRQLDESRPRSGFDPIGVLPAPPLPALPPLPAASPDSHGPTRGGAEMYQQQGDERHEQSPPTR